MKRAIMTTLLAAAISQSASANEWAKVTFAENATEKIPAQKIAIRETAAQTIPAQTSADSGEIADIIFTQTDMTQIAVLSPEEMAETEGAFAPAVWVAYTLAGGAFGAWANHIRHHSNHGEWASMPSTLFATGTGMIGVGHGAAIIRAANLTGGQAIKVGSGGAAITAVSAYGNPFNERAPARPADNRISDSWRNRTYEDK